MNDLETFRFRGEPVRVVLGSDGEPRWVAADIADILGYSSARDMTRSMHDRHKGV